jgi:hypothetical protein
MIAAHDCADRVPIPGLVEGAWPEAQIVDAEAHRYLVGTVVDATRPGVLLHGHYHVRYDAIRALPGGGQTAIVGLAGDSSSTRDNTLLLDLRRGDTGEALF